MRRLSRPPRWLAVALLLGATLILSACSQVADIGAQPVTLRVAGSSAMQPMLAELGAAFERAHPNVRVVTRGGGSELGIQALKDGSADVAAISWELDPTSQKSGLQASPVARDGLALIVNPKNRVGALTILQLRALYRGETLDWQTLGGPASEPLIISREEGSGDRAAFESLVMGGDRVTLNAMMLPTARRVADYVATHPDAIGYVSMAQLGDAVRPVPIEGIAPTPEDVRSGAYHLSRTLSLVLPRAPTTSARAFVDFALSPAGQRIVESHHVSLR